MKVTAKLNNFRVAPRKVRILSGVISGYGVDEAVLNLESVVKKSSDPLKALLKSAIANAENNFGLDRDNLYVRDFRVDEGNRLKRWLPRAFGRATPLIKRNSCVVIVLEERVEGKNRKSKEQLEKERNEKEESRKKMEKDILEKRKGEQDSKKGEKEKLHTGKEGKKTKKSGWVSKMFNRKSM